jgi:hypothetical protein
MLREPTMVPNIHDKIEEHWRAVYADMHREPPPRNGFHEMLLELETEARGTTTDGLQPQLGIFEFGLEWLAYVHVALGKRDELGPAHEDARAAWALIGAAVSFGLSIRSLCMNGFDTPGRALLRTYVETLFLCIALLHDRSLAKAYIAAEDDAQVKNFWHRSASPKNLHERIIMIEKRLGLEDAVVQSLAQWRQGEYEMLSQSSHLSYLAAVLTAVCPKLGEGETYAPGILGLASDHSLRTISYAARSTWYFSRMSNSQLLGKDSSQSLIVLDKENEWHQRMVAGRDTLSAVILEHWES